MDSKLQQRHYEQLSGELNIDVKAIKAAYQFYWRFIRKVITGFNIKQGFSREEFDKQKTYFNLTNLGRLYVEVKNKQIEEYERYIQSKRGESTSESCTPDSQ